MGDSPADDDSLDPPRLRRDALANRNRVLAAARAAIAERGPEVSIEEIARRAGVGVGTVYRRFPTKEALVDAIVDEQVAEIERLGARALADPDPWAGLVRFMRDAVERHRRDGRIKALVSSRLAATDRRTSVPAQLDAMCRRAQEAGVLRSDVGAADVLAVLWATLSLAGAVEGSFSDYGERFLTLLLDALRPEALSPLPGREPSPEALANALRTSSAGRA